MDKQAVIDKWKPILEFQSDLLPKLDESKYELVATKLEIYERIYKKHSPDKLKVIIPLIRAKEGLLDESCGEELLKEAIENLKRGNESGTLSDNRASDKDQEIQS